ncbi:MAG TPA: hypothetical protein VHC47_10680 [Mucilaginibacter sp.]|nr:hypothetical protein [Mucilaginibacter sp.]
MKKFIFLIAAVSLSVCGMAQNNDKPTFPFQGGNEVMAQFFRDSIKVSPEIRHTKASGVVIFKFTADEDGAVKNLVIYYADDAILARPLVEALRKSTRKWIIPYKEKLHDFIIPFLIKLNAPENGDRDIQSQVYRYYSRRKPIIARDQTPLDMATLLPTVVVNYDADN